MVRTLRISLVVAGVVAMTGAVSLAQRFTPADAAAKITGVWQMNMELSPQWAPRGGGAPGGGRGGQQQYFAASPTPNFGRTTTAFQRGGGGGGGGAAMSEADRAGNAVMAGYRQAPQTLTIKATETSVTFTDARGERTYAVDNKTAKMEINGVNITTKSRWDNRTLKQEFVFGESRITHDYELNPEGTRINFKLVMQNMGSERPPTEAKAVYDKKP